MDGFHVGLSTPNWPPAELETNPGMTSMGKRGYGRTRSGLSSWICCIATSVVGMVFTPGCISQVVEKSVMPGCEQDRIAQMAMAKVKGKGMCGGGKKGKRRRHSKPQTPFLKDRRGVALLGGESS